MKVLALDDAMTARFAGAGKRLRVEIPDTDADYWLTKIRHLTLEAATKETARMPVAASKPITGIRRLLIKWRLKRQYWAELKAAN